MVKYNTFYPFSRFNNSPEKWIELFRKISSKSIYSLFLGLLLVASTLVVNPPSAEAVQIGECNITSSSRNFMTSPNPNANRISITNIEDPEIRQDSHVAVSISEFAAEGFPFFGEAVFYVDDIAPYDGGFRLRTEVSTRINNTPLEYKIFYTAFTGNCR